MLLSHLEDGPVRAGGRKEEDRRNVAGKSHPSGTTPTFKHSMLAKGALRKQALIDLTSISAGLPFILGWYSLTTETTSCSGQIKVKVTPMEDISKHKNIWFKEYSQWEKGHKLFVNTESSKVDSNKWKMSGRVEQPSKSSQQQKDEKVSVDPIDRDLVYISLNQKLAELDKIPGYFKDKNDKSTEETTKPSCSKTSSILLSSAIDRNQPSTSSKLDIMDLNIDSDISYVNRLLSEIPNRLTSSRNHVNFTGINENEMYSRPVLGSTNQVLKKPQDFISASFNSSDVIDLENDKTKGKSFQSDIDRIRNLNLDHQAINLDMDIIDRNVTKTNSDESLRNQVQSISEQNRTVYQRLSPELSIENKTISGSSNLPSECYQQCSGNEPSSCVFNNRNIFPNASLHELSRMSPVISVASKENSSLLDPYEPNNYTRTENIPDYTGFQPTERLDVESDGTDEASKYVATLSGQSSLCTDDQSLHYSEPLNSQGIAYDLSFSDNAGNLHSDLMEEASSEIDRILRELKNNK